MDQSGKYEGRRCARRLRSENLLRQNRCMAGRVGDAFQLKIGQEVGYRSRAVKKICREGAPGVTGLLMSFVWLMLRRLQVVRVMVAVMSGMVRL